jgi:hypothetical protein
MAIRGHQNPDGLWQSSASEICGPAPSHYERARDKRCLFDLLIDGVRFREFAAALPEKLQPYGIILESA